jgi:hypothetical protein
VAGLLRRHTLENLEHCALLDDEISGKSSDEESSEGDDCIQLVLPETHRINDSDDRDDIATHDDEQMGMAGVSRIFRCRILEHSVPHMKHFVAFVGNSLILATWMLSKCFKSFLIYFLCNI